VTARINPELISESTLGQDCFLLTGDIRIGRSHSGNQMRRGGADSRIRRPRRWAKAVRVDELPVEQE
jgi:hypothetical protein